MSSASIPTKTSSSESDCDSERLKKQLDNSHFKRSPSPNTSSSSEEDNVIQARLIEGAYKRSLKKKKKKVARQSSKQVPEFVTPAKSQGTEVTNPHLSDLDVSGLRDDAMFETQETPVDRTCAEEQYLKHCCTVEALVTICIGLKRDDGSDLINENEEPFVGMKKREFKPKLDTLRDEVDRRWNLVKTINDDDLPIKKWKIPKCVEWLHDNPVTAEKDIEFLKQELAKMVQLYIEARQPPPEEGKSWRKDCALPFLRLMHCLCEDNVRKEYVSRAVIDNRETWDARNSEVRAPTWAELLAEKYADPSYNPKTVPTVIHSDFSRSVDIGFDAIKSFSFPDPTQCGSRLASLKGQVTTAINKWEESGAGECGLVPNHQLGAKDPAANESDGGVSTRPLGHYRAFVMEGTQDNRGNFLRGLPTFVGYYWYILEKFDLLKTTTQVLAAGVGAADGGVDSWSIDYAPSADSSVRTRQTQDTETNKILAAIHFRGVQEDKQSEEKLKREMHMKERLMMKEVAAKKQADFELIVQTENSKRRLTIQDKIDELEKEARQANQKHLAGDKIATVILDQIKESIEKYKAEYDSLQHSVSIFATTHTTPQRCNLSKSMHQEH